MDYKLRQDVTEDDILIAVYDDLRKGMSKHKNFENSKYLGTTMGKYLIAWLLGVPAFLLVIIYFIF